MAVVAFVAPYLLETTGRFVEAAARLPGVELALVTCEPLEKVPPRLRTHLAGHWQIQDGLDPAQVVGAVQGLSGQLGPVRRLIGVLEQLQVQLAQARGHLGIDGMDVATAHNFRDKAQMKSVWRAAGIPCARHRLADSAEVAYGFAAEVGLPIVVTPPDGAGAKSTFRIDDADELRVWLSTAPPTPDRTAMMEEFLTGEEGSFDSVLVDGKLVWHSISNYIPTPLEVLRNPWIQWQVLFPRHIDGPDYDEIRTIAPTALRELGLETGFTHLEWFRRPDGSVAISEVAVRPPGAQISSMLNFAHDFDLYSAWAQLQVYGSFDPPSRKWAVGTAFLRGQGSGRIRAVHGLADVQREIGSLVVDVSLPQPGLMSSGVYEGDGFVTVRHAQTPVVAEALRRLIDGVRVELE
ncbi:MAG: ATP-grasp domain-containing protein [Geodermatophilaceae bacterium]